MITSWAHGNGLKLFRVNILNCHSADNLTSFSPLGHLFGVSECGIVKHQDSMLVYDASCDAEKKAKP